MEISVSQETREILEAAFIELGKLGGNTLSSPYRTAWTSLRAILQARQIPVTAALTTP